MVVPLLARGVTLGLAFFSRHRTPEPFDADDLRLAQDLAIRAAVYIDNARRYTRERKTSLTLQSSLLPVRTPHHAAMDIAARCIPADPDAEIGGDWFDVIPLSGARVALVVGDVVGRGVQASATMGRLCDAVRTLADVDLAPDELLTQLDDLVLRLDRAATGDEARPTLDSPSEVGATCLYAIYDPVTRRCTMARAGHPPPALTAPDGTVEYLDLPAGPPLGLGGLPFEAKEFDVPEGSLLTLYTNGLLGDTHRDVDEALSVLRGLLSHPDHPLGETSDRVLRTLLPTRRSNEVALLVARSRALAPGHVATWDLPSAQRSSPRPASRHPRSCPPGTWLRTSCSPPNWWSAN
ncbi:PP2C family protein-serine/threonine phosphatase [Streptomyces sp. NPDC048291]|uniref:PP2C family protein-serine/threonine phosphatase n=1 Tax=Streptomyces sp. NPDC048291 TaxID=3365530 RepID=UPI00371F7D7E